MDDFFQERVVDFFQNNQWKEILELNANSDNKNAEKLLWVWPSENNLKFIEDSIKRFKLVGIISIGCGCGLLEWIIQQSSGIQVIGYEINQEWWRSRYSNPQFIPLKYPELPPTNSTLNPNFALLFCYFNNGTAFIEYVSCYSGDAIIIIGPGDGAGRHTNPQPFKPDFGPLNPNWKLHEFQEVKNTKDFIAIYTRKTIN